ncbi:3-isopropylmalate dehydrogenase [Bradyrhizobium sp. 30]|uniref:3-isopropylmalate dehydrogenase n=1 Tax=Bradyrhizobium sp. 30 TaxID=2782669 RepID=UPI001FF9A800|nr:3-isopropylmalate dehydrogenase [Bradyrhizobium sp. 30]MCK1290883.1 3-isopropylmalate dehydrogenase [Bradyrhizobium sp. 30]
MKIAMLPGDGIGPDVIRQARKVLQALRGADFTFDAVEAPVGGAAIDATGEPMPASTMKLALESDAVLLGAVGDARFDDRPTTQRATHAIAELRTKLGLYASLRQVSVSETLTELSPLRTDRVLGVDMLIVRELGGDVYMSRQRGQRVATDGPFPGDPEGYDMMSYSHGEVVRIARIAFNAARGRRKRLLNVDKANVLETSRLWRKAVMEVSKDYPDIDLTHAFADNAAMQLVTQPADVDVLLAANMFGDILSDVASVLTGSIGLTASVMLGDPGPGYYEAGHGSAPDIAGRNVANPIACIRAAVLMLRMSLERPDLADRVEGAILQVLGNGLRTAEIHSSGTRLVGTEEMGDAIAKAVALS